MAFLKLTVLLASVVLCAVLGANGVTSPPERDQTVIVGTVGANDKLLHSQTIDVPKSFLSVKTREVSYPPHPSSQGSNITCIKVLDQLRTGKNAYVKVTDGGIGKNFAKVELKSKRGYPIRYVVEFYGR